MAALVRGLRAGRALLGLSSGKLGLVSRFLFSCFAFEDFARIFWQELVLLCVYLLCKFDSHVI